MATIVCDPNALAIKAACFLPSCLGPDDRQAIDVHVRVYELAAIGGLNYIGNVPKLLKDTASWTRLTEDTKRCIALYLDIQNALNKGAVFASDINSLRSKSKCYLCIPWELRRAILLYLKCQLNSLGAPE